MSQQTRRSGYSLFVFSAIAIVVAPAMVAATEVSVSKPGFVIDLGN